MAPPASIVTPRRGPRFALAGLLLLGVALVGSCADHDEFWHQRLGSAPRLSNRLQPSALRAYDGAPPIIPHGVASLGRQSCLSCHATGAAVSADHRRRAPVTPHPERLACTQCHVPRRDDGLFRESTFAAAPPIAPPARAQPLSPPYIPHRLQDRERCRVCHIGPGARAELVPPHGDRPACLQCHVHLDPRVEPFVARAKEAP